MAGKEMTLAQDQQQADAMELSLVLMEWFPG